MSNDKEVDMTYDEFLRNVKEQAELADRSEAETTAVTVLQAVCDRLTGDEAEDLLAQLPKPLQEAVSLTHERPATMTANQFVERVARDLQIPADDAEKRIRTVFGVLEEAVTPGEFHDVLAQLPSGYFELLQA
jgi:uncharacterized protein (DUF2267 family)